jgi:membrane-associated phospholipid phosphatase
VATAFVVLERTPRQEPVLYGGVLAVLIALTWVSASTQSRGAYGLWALYIGSFAIFGVARSFADETGMGTHVDDLVTAEKTLTFGTVPTVWLQTELFDPWNISWLDHAATYMHWSYFVLPHLFAAHIFLGHRHLFERYVLLFVGVLAVGLAIYFLFPAAPPWVASIQGHIDPTYKIATEVGTEFHVNLYTKFEAQVRSSNPVAAMPSLHMAISVVVLLIAMRVNWTLGAVALLYNGAMAFSLIYLGEHYLVDILAGILVSVTVYAAVEVWLRHRDRALARAEAAALAADEPRRGPPAEPEMQT